MGEYWEEYYINTHGYSKDQIRLIGDHDLDGFVSGNHKESAICYIANVLVEDGTVRKKDFKIFLNSMSRIIDKKSKLYIKLHPRSDKSLYDVFNNHNVEFIRTGELPSTNVYIGHRSALLGRALYETDNLIIWRFACEEVCFYEQYALSVCHDQEELEQALNSIDLEKSINKKKEQISKVFWNNPDGSMHCAAKLINKYIIERNI